MITLSAPLLPSLPLLLLFARFIRGSAGPPISQSLSIELRQTAPLYSSLRFPNSFPIVSSFPSMKLSICSKFWRKKKGRKEGINRRKKEDPFFPRIRERKRKRKKGIRFNFPWTLDTGERDPGFENIERSRGRSRGNARCTHVQTCKQWEKGINEGRGGETENGALYSYETRRDPPLFVDSALRTGISKVIYLGRENKELAVLEVFASLSFFS